ncbi:MAG TPA: hypothetical protein VHA37_01895 [Candidatus Saccharimonadales bacterium]|nr:hypothetical protein [Candidatus Saccharimonadales bacterium]
MKYNKNVAAWRTELCRRFVEDGVLDPVLLAKLRKYARAFRNGQALPAEPGPREYVHLTVKKGVIFSTRKARKPIAEAASLPSPPVSEATKAIEVLPSV